MLSTSGGRRLFRAAVLATLVAAGGCRSGSAVTTIPTTPSAPPLTTSTIALVTASPTTSSSSTSSTPPSTVVLAVTTTVVAEDALRAQIVADYVKANGLEVGLKAAPTLDGLEARAVEIAPEGSDNYASLIAFVQGLVKVGDVVRANDKDPVHTVTVESVELVGSAPYTSAIATVCEVDNSVRVNTADRSPTGQDVPVFGTGKLRATRVRVSVVSTPQGWLPPGLPESGSTYEGVTSCPAA